MAKFGLFTFGDPSKPIQELEGDYMEQDNEVVKIFNKIPGRTEGSLRIPEDEEQVGVLKLLPGYFVKKIGD